MTRYIITVLLITLFRDFRLYSESDTLLASGQGAGDSINVVLPYPIEISEDFVSLILRNFLRQKIHVINYFSSYFCPVIGCAVVRIDCFDKKLYSFQLESNAIAPAPPDTYFYLIYYEDEDLMTQGSKKGYITLIRRTKN